MVLYCIAIHTSAGDAEKGTFDEPSRASADGNATNYQTAPSKRGAGGGSATHKEQLNRLQRHTQYPQ